MISVVIPMSHRTTSCVLCEKPRIITAEDRQWLIHIANHREKIIKFIVDNFSSCPLCAYPDKFYDKVTAANHLRWYHSKKHLNDWFFKNILLQNKTFELNH